MEQAIPAVSNGKAESKASNPADLMKMIDAASGTVKGKNTQPGKVDEDINALVVPFLQLLNQQMALLFQANKGSGTALVNKAGEKITLEQAKLLFQGNLTLKDLQQALANGTMIDQEINSQPGLPADALLKEIDLLKNNLATVDGNGEKNDILNTITVALNKEITTKAGNNENELKIINNKNSSLQTLEMELKKVTGAKLDGEKAVISNLQSPLKNEVADNEVKLRTEGKANQSVLKNDGKILNSETVIFKEVQLSENPVSKVTVNSAAVKEENQISKNILPDESGKIDPATRINSRLSTQEMKESLIGKDNLRFVQEQYMHAAANADAGDKTKIESIQAILGELSDKIKPEQKAKTIIGEIRNEETSLSSINGTGSGSAKIEKINDVSPGEIISQITNEIKENAANDGGRVKITLNPPSLGTLEMDVTVRNGKVDVVLTADNKDVQQILNSHIDKLKGSLQTQGLTIERCDVMMQDKREEYHQSFSQHAFYHNGSGQGNNGRQENPEVKVKANTPITEQRVNILRVTTDNISLFA